MRPLCIAISQGICSDPWNFKGVSCAKQILFNAYKCKRTFYIQFIFLFQIHSGNKTPQTKASANLGKKISSRLMSKYNIFLLHGLLAPYHIRFKHAKLTFARLEAAIDSSIFTSSPHVSYDVDFR